MRWIEISPTDAERPSGDVSVMVSETATGSGPEGEAGSDTAPELVGHVRGASQGLPPEDQAEWVVTDMAGREIARTRHREDAIAAMLSA